MKKLALLFLLFVAHQSFAQNGSEESSFFEFIYDDSKGNIHLNVEFLDKEFLYVNAIASGLGSNDIGLDRGKLMDTRIVKFIKRGNKILLLQPNQKYKANSNNIKEVKAVEEAFAQSILWGFEIVETKGNKYKIDLTPFLLSDQNGIVQTLKNQNQGNFKLDKSTSAIQQDQCFSFAKNTEFEAILTYTGEATGGYIKSVTPTSSQVTAIQHISFIALPDDGYKPRAYHPYSGYFDISYYDYATPIYEPIDKKFIVRHRLIKKDPMATLSEAIEPIVYYVDAGCPEPIKSALIEGASWWNQAFTEAGFKDAFQVKELPDGAHPLDVRYNVIQWVHRSTRGWSYGASIVDPRTGEIIKGHVSLGSLRVRQDFMIAQGLISPYSSDSENHEEMLEMSLARLRQLSAHEVGHTIGLAHNFAASANDRASVMDYPYPYVSIQDGNLDLSDAYDDKIGLWDKRAIVYGYREFPNREENEDLLRKVLLETKSMKLDFLSDPDARPETSAHPTAHLWDNGTDAAKELDRLMEVRTYALSRFGDATIFDGTPYSELEKILVPTYLMHRYQVEAASKMLGGVDYTYAVKGYDQPEQQVVDRQLQLNALQSIIETLKPTSLDLPDNARKLLLPSAYGYNRSTESFGANTGLVFDPYYMAEAYSDFVFSLILKPERLARVNQQELTLYTYLKNIKEAIFTNKGENERQEALSMIVQKTFVIHLVKLTIAKDIDKQVAAMCRSILKEIEYNGLRSQKATWNAHFNYINQLISQLNSDNKLPELPKLAKMPPGSPIGC